MSDRWWEQDEIIEPAGAPTASAEEWWANDPIEDGPQIADLPAVQTAPPDFGRVRAGVSVKPERSKVETEKRGLGLGARSAMQSLGGLVGVAGGDAFNAYVANPIQSAFTGRDVPYQSFRDIAGGLASRVGLPSAENSRERVLGDIGEALSGTALTMGAGGLLNAGRTAATSSRMGDLLTAQPVLQAVSSATGAGASGITRESGGSQGRQLTAGLLGALAPGAATAGAGATLRGAVRGSSGAQMQRNIDDFGALGVTPSLGQATERPAIQGLENLLGGGPTSAGVMSRFAERQADGIGESLRARSQTLSPNASGENAGRAIERGINTFSRNTSATRRALYWQADQFIPPDTATGMTRTQQALANLTTPTPGALETTGALVNPRLAQLRDNLATDLTAGNGQIPYSALRNIRTEIGEQLGDAGLNPDIRARELKQLYRALSEDMQEVARTQGPQANRAARRANAYTRATADRMEQVERIVDKNGGPEAVFNAAMQGTKDGATTLRAVMQSLPAPGQRALTGAVIRRMGLATPGAQDVAGDVFSSATFATNWNRLSPEAKRALFDRHGLGFRQDMDRIANVATNIRDGSKVLANPSGSGNRAAAWTYGAALVGSLMTGQVGTAGTVAVGGLGANVMARAMTNPRAVRYLARATQMPRGTLPAMLNSMRTEGQKKQDEDLVLLADELQNRIQEDRNRSD